MGEHEGKQIVVDFDAGNKMLLACINRVFEERKQDNQKQLKNQKGPSTVNANSTQLEINNHVRSCVGVYGDSIEAALLAQFNKYGSMSYKKPNPVNNQPK